MRSTRHILVSNIDLKMIGLAFNIPWGMERNLGPGGIWFKVKEDRKL
jgi:hypothetical protein